MCGWEGVFLLCLGCVICIAKLCVSYRLSRKDNLKAVQHGVVSQYQSFKCVCCMCVCARVLSVGTLQH